MPTASPGETVPLCVDLDGTLVVKDTTLQTVSRLLVKSPLEAFRLLGWLVRGRAHLKAEVAQRIQIDPQDVTYVPPVRRYTEHAHGTGRPTFLVTATDQKIARQIVRDCPIFQDVFASDGHVNLRSVAKRACCVARFGEQGFDYIGNSRDDLVVWAAARKKILSPLTPPGVRRQAYTAFPEKDIIAL